MNRFFSLFLVLTGLVLLSCSPKSTTTDSTSTPTAEVNTLPKDEVTALPKDDVTIEDLDAKYPEAGKAYFAGGCFWCTEAAFDRIQGVIDVWSGYAGGPEKDPTYRQVASGMTGHAEAIVVYYDKDKINYDKLLDIFFVAHDPTQLNRQGPDVGAQYRSEIFYLSEDQKQAAEAKIAALDASDKFNQPIVTKVSAADKFYVAEGYHQDYYEDPTNPNQGYVQNVSRPKVEKVMKTFAEILKPEFKN